LSSSDAALENSLVVKLFDDVQTASIGEKDTVCDNHDSIWRRYPEPVRLLERAYSVRTPFFVVPILLAHSSAKLSKTTDEGPTR
jgi:hypothetical protein